MNYIKILLLSTAMICCRCIALTECGYCTDNDNKILFYDPTEGYKTDSELLLSDFCKKHLDIDESIHNVNNVSAMCYAGDNDWDRSNAPHVLEFSDDVERIIQYIDEIMNKIPQDIQESFQIDILALKKLFNGYMNKYNLYNNYKPELFCDKYLDVRFTFSECCNYLKNSIYIILDEMLGKVQLGGDQYSWQSILPQLNDIKSEIGKAVETFQKYLLDTVASNYGKIPADIYNLVEVE